METSGVLRLNSCCPTALGKSGGGSSGLPSVRCILGGEKKVKFGALRLGGGFRVWRDGAVPKVCCSHKKLRVELDSSNVYNDEDDSLKRKAASVTRHLNGRSVYLVGMMGSGKSTVGKILAEALDYTFVDSDTLIERAVGSTVAQIFMDHSEDFFRDNETMVLRDLSLMERLVVATGGGAVIRSVNWKYMNCGITVLLDVPLEALARRIAAIGTASRPLLHQETGDAYRKALLRLHELSEERGETYMNADAKVSLECIAVKQGLDDVNELTPTVIAVEALESIEDFLLSCQLEGSNV